MKADVVRALYTQTGKAALVTYDQTLYPDSRIYAFQMTADEWAFVESRGGFDIMGKKCPTVSYQLAHRHSPSARRPLC